MTKGILAVVIVAAVVSVALAEIGEPVLVGRGRRPRWSPDGTWIVMAHRDTLVVVNATTFERRANLFVGANQRYYWSNDSTIASLDFRRYIDDTLMLRAVEILEVSIDGWETPIAFDSSDTKGGRRVDLFRDSMGNVILRDDRFGERHYISLANPHGIDTTVAADLTLRTLQGEYGEVWLFHGCEPGGKRVTLSENHYRDPILSPSGDRFLCWAMRGDLVVFDTLGNELANLGRVERPVWSWDGNWIHYMEVTYSHYDVEGADSWISKFDGSERRRLTFTPNRGESTGDFSPCSRFLTYSDAKSGQVYIVGLN